jgi:hypothetical protein
MISVLLLGTSAVAGRPATSADAVRTLSALVSGAVDGVVRDVQLLSADDGPNLAQVAEHAGCGYVRATDLGRAIATGVGQARTPHLLVLPVGISFDRALTDEVAAAEDRHAGWLGEGVRLKAAAEGPFGRLLPPLAPTVGVLTSGDRLLAARETKPPRLWRKLRPRHVFRARGWIGSS